MVQIIEIPTLTVARQTAVETLRAELANQGHTWTGNSADPAFYLLEQMAADSRTIQALLNSSARALAYNTATGSDLDDLIPSPFSRDGRSDADYLAAWVGLLQRLSGETKSYLEYLAFSVTGVSDASFLRLPNYQTWVYVQAANYAASTDTLRHAVQQHMNQPTVKEWYADYTVTKEERVNYEVNGDAQYYPDIDENILR